MALRRELVGSFLLSQLQNLDVNIGLYRDDSLAISNAEPKDAENIKREICRVFNQNGLRITIEANKQVINFLDVTFNLNNGTYQPQRTYLPASTRRLSSLSSDKASFDQATPHIKKHSTKADTTTRYTMDLLLLLNGETGNATTSSGTTPHSAKTSTPTSVKDSSP